MKKKKLFVDKEGKLQGADNRRYKRKFGNYLQVYVQIEDPNGDHATHVYNPLPNTTEALGFVAGLAIDLFKQFPTMDHLVFFIVDSEARLRAQLKYNNPSHINS